MKTKAEIIEAIIYSLNKVASESDTVNERQQAKLNPELELETKEAIRKEQKIREAIDPPYVHDVLTFDEDGIHVEKQALIGSISNSSLAMTKEYNKAHTLFLQGLKLSENGDSKGAIEAFRKAYAEEPEYRDAAFQLAYHTAQAGNFNEALNLYFEILRRDLLDEHVWCNIGGILLYINLKLFAKFFFEISLLIDPEDKIAISGLEMIDR